MFKVISWHGDAFDTKILNKFKLYWHRRCAGVIIATLCVYRHGVIIFTMYTILSRIQASFHPGQETSEISGRQCSCIAYLVLTVCSYHVTYAFQSESTLYSCLNVKVLLARSRREILSLSDWNWTRTHNHLVHKRTLNHLAKPAKWLNGWVFVYKLSGCGFESSCSHIQY